MTQLIEQVIAGVITGSLYGLLGLAFVLVYRSTGVVNFSQGEMATFTTFVAWTLMQFLPYPVAFLGAAASGFLLGCVVERTMIRPAARSSDVNVLTVVVGLFLVFGALTRGVYGAERRALDHPFRGSPVHLGDVAIPRYGLFVLAVACLLMAAMYLFFQRTSLGLALRATASDRSTAELMGLATGRLLMLGWGLAGAMGAAAGVLVAPIIGLTAEMMILLIVAALSAVLIGGLTSPIGAVVGGVLIGIVQNLVATYADDGFGAVGIHVPDPNSFREIAVVVLFLIVLYVRPGGLFGAAPTAVDRG